MTATSIRAAQVSNQTLTDTQEATANVDGVPATASLRTLGTGAQQACAGNDSRLPTQAVNASSSPTHANLTLTGDLSVQGNTTLGDASTDTITVNAATLTFPNAVTIVKSSQAGVAETVQSFKVSDSASLLSIINGTSADGAFAPAISCVMAAADISSALSFFGTKGADDNTNPAILFLGRFNSGGGNTDLAAATPMVEFRNRATSSLIITGGHNLKLLGGATSPVLLGAAADTVSMAAVDKAAGDRRLYIQAEQGLPISFGKDRINFDATIGVISVGGIDLLSMTATAFTIITKITSYNGINTVGNGVPSEVANVDGTALNAAIAATTLYTPVSSGLFRLSIHLQVTQAATTSCILGGATGLVITYTDPDASQAQSLTIPLATPAGVMAINSTTNSKTSVLHGTAILNAKAAAAIQYAIGYTSVGGTPMLYAAHLKLEAL